ncbi:MAG: hypothetical protein ACSLEM_00485 [Candidatus Malihini olakiniferum]
MHIVEYWHNQKQLMETSAQPHDLNINANQAHQLIQLALSNGVIQPDIHEV